MAAMLRSMTQLLERGPAEDLQQFFCSDACHAFLH